MGLDPLAPSRDRWLIVRGGLLIDGNGGAPTRADVLVRGATIAEVGPTGSIRVRDGSAVEIDASDATVIPGLIDCHLHVTYSGHIGMQQLEWPGSLELAAVSAGANATTALMHGYTSALDVGCRGQIGVATKQAIAKGTIRGPDLRVSRRPRSASRRPA